MLNTPEITLSDESDPDLKTLKDSLTGQEENSPVRKAISDYLQESGLTIQIALLNIMYGRLESTPGVKDEDKKELTDAIAKSRKDLEEVRGRIRDGDGDYAKAYTRLRVPAMRYINNSAPTILRQMPVLGVLGRTISSTGGGYEGQLIAKFKAIDNIRRVNNITTFVNNLNKPATPK